MDAWTCGWISGWIGRWWDQYDTIRKLHFTTMVTSVYTLKTCSILFYQNGWDGWDGGMDGLFGWINGSIDRFVKYICKSMFTCGLCPSTSHERRT